MIASLVAATAALATAAVCYGVVDLIRRYDE